MESSRNLDSTTIEDPTMDPRAAPFLIFPLTVFDQGSPHGRVTIPEYQSRRPFCIEDSENDRLILSVRNVGEIASDLIKLDYQFVFCVQYDHGVTEGFTRPHAGEVGGSLGISDNFFIDFVPAQSTKKIPIQVPVLPANIANLYFRCRVSTLWSKPLDPANWDFATDPSVIEFTKRAWTHR